MSRSSTSSQVDSSDSDTSRDANDIAEERARQAASRKASSDRLLQAASRASTPARGASSTSSRSSSTREGASIRHTAPPRPALRSSSAPPRVRSLPEMRKPPGGQPRKVIRNIGRLRAALALERVPSDWYADNRSGNGIPSRSSRQDSSETASSESDNVRSGSAYSSRNDGRAQNSSRNDSSEFVENRRPSNSDLGGPSQHFLLPNSNRAVRSQHPTNIERHNHRLPIGVKSTPIRR
jgi:hypothetical protein